MSIKRLFTRHDPQNLIIPVTVNDGKQNIRVVVVDDSQDNTVLIDRTRDVEGKFDFVARLPLTPMFVRVYVYNTANGNKNEGEDPTFSLGTIKRTELERKMDEVDMKNPLIKSFVTFAQRFAYNAGHLKAGNTLYNSEDNKFFIRYVDDIVDAETKEAIPTPLRVDTDSGLIEAAADDLRSMTVPRRFALLCHEFAHKYLNDDQNNEVEADLRGSLLYLCLGYPRVEGLEAFMDTFIGNPTEENKERCDILIDFYKKFDKENQIFYE